MIIRSTSTNFLHKEYEWVTLEESCFKQKVFKIGVLLKQKYFQERHSSGYSNFVILNKIPMLRFIRTVVYRYPVILTLKKLLWNVIILLDLQVQLLFLHSDTYINRSSNCYNQINTTSYRLFFHKNSFLGVKPPPTSKTQQTNAEKSVTKTKNILTL